MWPKAHMSWISLWMCLCLIQSFRLLSSALKPDDSHKNGFPRSGHKFVNVLPCVPESFHSLTKCMQTHRVTHPHRYTQIETEMLEVTTLELQYGYAELTRPRLIIIQYPQEKDCTPHECIMFPLSDTTDHRASAASCWRPKPRAEEDRGDLWARQATSTEGVHSINLLSPLSSSLEVAFRL